jgi:hypothetical protein
VRVAELEREIKQMRLLLKPKQSILEISGRDSDEDPEEQQKDQPKDGPSLESSATSIPIITSKPVPLVVNEFQELGTHKRTIYISNLDMIDRGIISKTQAEELLAIYRKNRFPGIVIPPEWTAYDLRAKKPALFYAVMAAASRPLGKELSNRLHDELTHVYARDLLIDGKKSVQHIQALLVTVAFYCPANAMQPMQVYQYGTMAATAALELGLASKPRTHEQLPRRAVKTLQKISSAEELLENCRTILSLYVMSAG